MASNVSPLSRKFCYGLGLWIERGRNDDWAEEFKGLAALVEIVAEPGVGFAVEMAEGIALTVSPLSPGSSMVSGFVLERAGNDD